MTKSWNGPYVPGKRFRLKIKHQRTADCVVIGWRKSSDGSTLGALLLGLYDKKGTMHYVGHTSSFNAAERKELVARLKPLKTESPEEEWRANPGRMPGGLSRWSRGKDTEWVAVRPELVCEVTYDKLEAGERFRHATGFLRWRTDKKPRQCGFDQIASAAEFDVRGIFRSEQERTRAGTTRTAIPHRPAAAPRHREPVEACADPDAGAEDEESRRA